MFQVVADFSVRVLHVRSHFIRTLNGSENTIENALNRVELQVDRCRDVYRSLARLGRANGKVYRAAVVCVDGLGEAEMRFFPAARRLCQGVGIFVYGSSCSEARVREAIRLGATGRVSREVLEGMVRVDDVGAMTRPAIRRPESDLRTDPHHDLPLEGEGERQVNDVPYEKGEGSRVDDPTYEKNMSANEETCHPTYGLRIDGSTDVVEEEDSAVRVPWGRYEGGPRRVGPRKCNEEDRRANEEESRVDDPTDDGALEKEKEGPLIESSGTREDDVGSMTRPTIRRAEPDLRTARGSEPTRGSEPAGGSEPLLTAEELAALMADLEEELNGEVVEGLHPPDISEIRGR
ncbi:MAG: hypothetical protein AABZ47_12815 [Planctomycetota bacterium]